LHLIDGTNDVKDFDVWTFFAAHLGDPPFPWRRRRAHVFGDPMFGRPPEKPDFVGRRVDLLGRSLQPRGGVTQDAILSGYLSEGATETARALSKKAVVLLEPADRLGAIVWPPMALSPHLNERCQAARVRRANPGSG